LGRGWSATSICAAIGIDRSTLFRWQQRDPDLCNTGDNTPTEHRATFQPESDFRDVVGSTIDADDELVAVVPRRKPLAAPVSVITRHDPAITAADRERARIAANHAPRPLGPARDEPWRAYVGIDGVIGRGDAWGAI